MDSSFLSIANCADNIDRIGVFLGVLTEPDAYHSWTWLDKQKYLGLYPRQ